MTKEIFDILKNRHKSKKSVTEGHIYCTTPSPPKIQSQQSHRDKKSFCAYQEPGEREEGRTANRLGASLWGDENTNKSESCNVCTTLQILNTPNCPLTFKSLDLTQVW